MKYTTWMLLMLWGFVLCRTTLASLHATHFNHHRLDRHLGLHVAPSQVHLLHDRTAKPSGVCSLEGECYYMLHLQTTSQNKPHATIRSRLQSDDVHMATTAGHMIVFSSIAMLRSKFDRGDVVDLWRLPSSMKLDNRLQAMMDESVCTINSSDTRRHVIIVKHASGSAAGQALKAVLHDLERQSKDQQCVLQRGDIDQEKGSTQLFFVNVCNCSAQLAHLAELHFVRWIEPLQRFTALNSVATLTMQDPTGTHHHRVWDHGITGATQIIGIGDTGLDYDSCFFRDDHEPVVFFPKTNPKHRKVVSYKECVDDNGQKEHIDRVNGHGTHVAGSAAGSSLGANKKYNGMAKGAKIFFHDLTCGVDDGLYLPGDLYDFFVPQFEAGARVGSNSWGSSSPKVYTAVDRETDRFSYLRSDYLAVFAAGNNAYAGILSPSSSKNVLTVGAHANSLEPKVRGTMGSFSAQGPTYDGRIKPDVTAPGTLVHSAKSDGALHSNQCSITVMNGTSMATPFVAGSAALLREYLQLGYYPSGSKNKTAAITPTGSLLKALLIHSTVPMEFVFPKETPNKVEGFGRLELNKLFTFSDGSDSVHHQMRLFQNVSVNHGGSFIRCLSYAGTNVNVVATLAWMDPPHAAEGAHMSITNDLDVTIADSAGKLHFANGKTSFTRGQNVERITIPSSSIPRNVMYFTVHVHGAHVDATRSGESVQPFSLVVSGEGLEHADSAKCSNNRCPNDCSGHGQCIRGLCQCRDGYHLVDCSECDAATVCHGNGQCDAVSKKCTCNAQIAPSSEHCTTCTTGYFGPHCAGTCSCGVHGACDYDLGVCQCHSTDREGHWHGPHCAKCAPDFMDTLSGCKKPAFWCENKNTRHIISDTEGTIVINDWGYYENSQQCAWLIEAAHPSWHVKLVVTSMDIETPYDTLSIFSGVDDQARRLAKLSGTTTTTVSSSGPSMLVKFEADYVGPGKGFTATFTIQRSCKNVLCHGHGRCNEQQRCTCEAHYNASMFCSTCDRDWTGTACRVHATNISVAPSLPTPTSINRPTPQPANLCLSSSGQICSGHGECDAESNICSCTQHYVGYACQTTCPVVPIDDNDKPCSGRGICTPDGCVCDTPSRNIGRACQVIGGALVKLSRHSPMERVKTSNTSRWIFGTFETSSLSDSRMQPVLRIVVKNLAPPPTKSPFRLLIWDGDTNVGDMRKAHLSTSDSTHGALCVEIIGWRPNSYFGVFDGTTSSNESNSHHDAIVIAEERSPKHVPGCKGQLCQAKRCTQSGPQVVPGLSPLNNQARNNKAHRRTHSFMRIEASAAAVGGLAGACLGVLLLCVVFRKRQRPSGYSAATGDANASCDGEVPGDDIELTHLSEHSPPNAPEAPPSPEAEPDT